MGFASVGHHMHFSPKESIDALMFLDMAERIDSDQWAQRIAAVIGQQVRRLRRQPAAKLTAQELADRTAALGHPIKRTVIANLEAGRRGTVTVADLLVLARALNVPPVTLLGTLETAESVEILPGLNVSPVEAFQWLTGEQDISQVTPWVTTFDDDGRDRQVWRAATTSIRLLREHASLVRTRHAHEIQASAYSRSSQDAEDSGLAENHKTLALRETELVAKYAAAEDSVRKDLAELGVILPQSSAI